MDISSEKGYKNFYFTMIIEFYALFLGEELQKF